MNEESEKHKNKLEKADKNSVDIFDEMLKDSEKQSSIEALRQAVDNNEKEIMPEGEEEKDKEKRQSEWMDFSDSEEEEEYLEEYGAEEWIEEKNKKKQKTEHTKKNETEEQTQQEKEEKTKTTEEDEIIEDNDNEAIDEEYPDFDENEDEKSPEDWDDEEFDFDVDHYSREEKKYVAPNKEEIKKVILEKADKSASNLQPEEILQEETKLSFLSDNEKKAVFIGRKASVFANYKFEGGLHVGKVKEKEFEDWDVYLDSLNPHVVFVCGARGSGKSYVLGVIAEELAEKNKNVGIIVVDPIGVFWSMRFPNKDQKEIEKLKEWGLDAKGLNNVKVFIPEGMKGQVPKSTYDAGFSIKPSLLTSEDWALTFGVDRFSVSGLLLDKVLKKVEKGYKKIEGNTRVPPKGANYSLDDLIECLETDSELNSKDKGYKPDSIRAIVSRFEAAKSWGIFHEKGTALGELSREGQLTILDTSFLEDNVTALVIGILSRRLLAARKISTRKEAANKFKSLSMNELLELEIPPTWLFIDEAHTLIPSGNEITAATQGLIEYVKQGRRPGLSVVFATQQPSAINTKVLSQLDIIITHKLIFDDDIKAVFKRTPTIIPRKYRAPNFIKTLPVGVALTGDRREETSRAFVMAIRPRKSQHEGRDAETTGMAEQIDASQVDKIAFEMLVKNIKEEKSIDMDKAKLAIETLNSKYKAKIDMDKLLKKLAEAGFEVSSDKIGLAGLEKFAKNTIEETKSEIKEAFEKDEIELKELSKEPVEKEKKFEELKKEISSIVEPTVELLTLPPRIDEKTALKLADGVRKKAIFGIFGKSESIEGIMMKYSPIWKIVYDAITNRRELIAKECYINSKSGEFLHFKNGKFIESRGLRAMSILSQEEIEVIKILRGKHMVVQEIMAAANIDEAKALRIINRLLEKKLIIKKSENEKSLYTVSNYIDLPPDERHELLSSISSLPFTKTEALNVENETVTKDEAVESFKKLWPNTIVKKVDVLYWPIWNISLTLNDKKRVVQVDAVTGKIL
jgi:hypothetical protein